MKRRINRRKKISLSIVSLSCLVLLFFVLTMSFGFSSFSSSISMTDLKAYVRYDQNVRVTGVSAAGSANGGSIVSTDYNVSNIVADVRMNQANSSVTFSVDVKNYGNVEMGIDSITLPAQYQNIFDVSVSNYTLGDKIRDNNDACESSPDGCTLNIHRNFNVTLTYKNGAYNSNQYLFENVIIQFNFKEIHKVTFTGFTILQPTMQAHSAMDGRTYSYNIGPYDQLAVKIGGIFTNNYTIDGNNVITIPNVQDDVEIIISEIMFNFDITVAPSAAQSGDTIKYVLNGGSEVTVTGNGIHLSVPYGSNLTINSIESYGYRTKTNINYSNISANVNDTITMDQVFYLDVTADVSGTSFNYTIDGVAQAATTDHLEGEYDPGTVIVITPSKTNYRPENATYTYTMNQHRTNETIHMIRQYTYTATAVVPVTQSLSLSVNGTPTSINSGQTYVFDEGTTVQLTASATGYRTKTLSPQTMNSNKSENVTLTKTYIYTVNAVSPSSGMTLALTVNGVSRGNVSSGYSEELDVNSTITLVASATDYLTETINHTITSNITDNVSLQRIVSFKVEMLTPTEATPIEIKCANNAHCIVSADNTLKIRKTCTGSNVSNCEANVLYNSSVEYTTTANYYQVYNGSVSSVTYNLIQYVTMTANPTQTAIQNASYSGLSNALSGSTYRKDVTRNVLTNCSTACKIIHFKVSGNIDNGSANVENGTFSIKTDTGGTLTTKNFSSKSRGKRDIYDNRDWSIASAPTCDGSVVIHFEKGGFLTVTTPNITIDEVSYINK